MLIRLYAMAGLLLILALAGGGGCARCHLPPAPPAAALKPGHYVRDFFAVPGLRPEQLSCALAPFAVEEATGIAAEDFSTLLEEELAKAWAANGLKTAGPAPPCRLAGAVHRVALSGRGLRFLTGQISAQLVVSGSITQNGQVLFAFRDCLTLDSPVNPGPPAPMESKLLLRHLSRAFAHRLLNQLLLHGATADSK